MTAPGKPANESVRIETLISLNLLDTPTEERFDRYTRLAQRMFDTPVAIIGLTDRSRQWFKSAQGCGEVAEVPRDIAFCAHTILGEDILEVSDAREDNRFCDNPMVAAEDGLRFYAGAPIVVSGCNIGTLCITDNKPRELTEAERTSFRDIASMISDEMVAYIDPLTGLSNRRGFRAAGDRVVEDCRNSEQTATIIIFDIDHFKAINDQYGHEQGDTVLRDFSRMLQRAFRGSDTIARLGGDEFTVLLTDSNADIAMRCLNRLESEVARANENSKLPYQLAFSSGIAEFDRNLHRSIQGLVHDADKRMYRVKYDKYHERVAS